MTQSFPKTLELCRTKNIKLYLGSCKIVCTLKGKWCLVSPIFGAGYYGTFSNTGDFCPTAQCTPEMIQILQDVETNGLQAVSRIGIATGICCICGRTLTAENSINGGIGPICASKVGFVSPSMDILELDL